MHVPTRQQRVLLDSFARYSVISGIVLCLGRADLLVEEVDDGGMGSFKISYKTMGVSGMGVKFEPTLSGIDSDGIPIYATLFLRNGIPSDVDVWKVDFSATVEMPTDWRIDPSIT